ncbi:MAG: hypothetical protein WBB89_19895 [Candidatus Acidiferrum sp.]
MPSAPNRRFPPLRIWLWAIAWSTLFTGLFLAMLSSDSCFLLINSREYVWTITGLAWIWLYLFFLFGNRGRLGLIACSALLVFPIWQADRFPAAAAEARAVVELRSMAQAVETYRTEHPQQGYPAVLLKKPSNSLKKLYEIEYQTSRTKVDGPIDVFLIQVTPTWSECVVRSFATAEDGQIHFVINRRPATKADPVL